MNKKKIIQKIKELLYAISLVPVLTCANAQVNTGIRFETGLSWKQVLAKAKAENKYIFMDCYATWCGPCKQMSRNIFPQESVGTYFNTHFINVAVQMDKTSSDLQEVKDWYSDARSLSDLYCVNEYPTYLFFGPNGQIVHRIAGMQGAIEFIAEASNVFKPEKQYERLKANWKNHVTDSVYLLNVLNSALKASDIWEAKQIGHAYIESLNAPLTRDNISLFYQNKLINSSHDELFRLSLKNALSINQLMKDSDYVALGLSDVIYREEILPFYGSGKPVSWHTIVERLKLVYPILGNNLIAIEEYKFQIEIKKEIEGIVNKGGILSPEWNIILKELKRKYPDYDCIRILLKTKTDYYIGRKMFIEGADAAYLLLLDYGQQVHGRTLNNIIWYNIFLHCGDQKILLEALKWMKIEIERDPLPNSLDTYANLLYKVGRVREAIDYEKKALSETHSQNELKDFQANLNKIQESLPTWLDESPVPLNKI